MKNKFTSIKGLFCAALIGVSGIAMAVETIVTPGDGTLEVAISAAVPGDVLILADGGVYNVYGMITIDKELTIEAATEPRLPALSGLPVIQNFEGTVAVLFDPADGMDLTMSGIEVNMGGAADMFAQTSPGTIKWKADKCRFHNMTGSAWQAGKTNAVLAEMKVTNSFFYNIGEKPVYNKNFIGKTNQLYQNNTYWNIGQQLDYFNWYDNEADPIVSAEDATIIYDHCTAANIASGGGKEFMGNSIATDGTRAITNIVVKNSIFAFQGTLDTDFSIKGGISTGGASDGFFDIINICAFEVWPVQAEFTGTVTNWFEADPMFADTSTMDFTVGSADAGILSGADDGTILGAIYWAPDYNPSLAVKDIPAELSLNCYPNPTSGVVKISYTVPSMGNVSVTVLNMVGQEVRNLVNGSMPAGNHEISLDTRSLSNGIYLCRVGVEGKYETQKLIVK